MTAQKRCQHEIRAGFAGLLVLLGTVFSDRISLPGRRSLAGSASSAGAFESTSTSGRCQSIAARGVHEDILARMANQTVALEEPRDRRPIEVLMRVVPTACGA